MTKLKELEKQLEIAEEEHSKKLNNLPDNLSFQQFEAALEATSNKVAYFGRQIRFLKEPEFKELSKGADRMSLIDFIEDVKDGYLIDYDGFGHYVKDNKDSGITIIPSDVEKNSIRKDFTEIVWFNR